MTQNDLEPYTEVYPICITSFPESKLSALSLYDKLLSSYKTF